MKIPKFINDKLRKHYYESFVKQEHRTVLEYIPAENVCFKNRTFLLPDEFERYSKDEEFKKDVLYSMFRDALPQITNTTAIKYGAYSNRFNTVGYEIEVELRGFKY